METTKTAYAVIYWDEQDPDTIGWAWAYHPDGDPNVRSDSGPLGRGYSRQQQHSLDALQTLTDDQLLERFRKEVGVECDDVRIERP